MRKGIAAARELVRAALVLLESEEASNNGSSRALMVSQRTVLPTFGVPPRTFLEDLCSGRFEGEIVKKGKLRLVSASAYQEFLVKSATAQRAADDGAEGVLAELGLRVVGGGRS